jgi:hypothetical protein
MTRFIETNIHKRCRGRSGSNSKTRKAFYPGRQVWIACRAVPGLRKDATTKVRCCKSLTFNATRPLLFLNVHFPFCRICKVQEDNIAGDKPYAQIAIEYATLAFSRTTSFAFLSFLIPRKPRLPGARIRIRLSRVDPLNSVSGTSNIRILTAAWKGKSWNFRLRQLTDRPHVDGPASTTHNSLSAWLAIVSARSKRSPRQETPTQSNS